MSKRLTSHGKGTNFLQKDKLIQPNTAGSVEELYRKLNTEADGLRKELGRPVSMGEALLRLIESMKLEAKDLTWSWRINETWSTETIHGKKRLPGSRLANRQDPRFNPASRK